MFQRQRGTTRWIAGVVVAIASIVMLAACGSSSSKSSSAANGGSSTGTASAAAETNTSASSASTGCGTLPSVAPSDADGAVAALGKSYAANYNGFTDYPIVPSPWSKWKPRKASGWNVQIVWAPLTNPFTEQTLDALKARLKASGKVATIGVQAPAAYTDVPQQLQEIGTALQRKPDLLIVFPLAPPPVAPLVAKAAAAGVPTISAWTLTPSKAAVSIAMDPYLNEGLTAAGALKLIGGKGSVLEVQGIPGTSTDADASAAWTKALSRCPGVKVAGTVVGQFVAPVAKQAVQQFISTHPAGVQGVLQAGTMGVGVLGAFQQTGHTPPPMADPGTAQGTIAYWHGHASFNAVATATPDPQIGNAVADVTLRMLEGQGVKLNVLLDKPYVVTKSNLASVWKPSFAASSPLDAVGPDATFMTEDYLNGFFKHGKAP